MIFLFAFAKKKKSQREMQIIKKFLLYFPIHNLNNSSKKKLKHEVITA